MLVTENQEQETAQNIPVTDDGGGEETLETPESFDNSEESEAPGEVPAGEGKYRIGSKSFATLEEAHAYAQSHISELETTVQVTDAYRQGMRDAMSNPGNTENVTPPPQPEDDFNEEEYYADPRGFLKKFKTQVQKEVLGTIKETQAQQEQNDAIWREFGNRHPMYADKFFQDDIEAIAREESTTLRAILATKGKDAAYDFCALKLKEKIDRYTQAGKPSRKLSNSNQGATPTMGASKKSSVTPPKTAEKPLSFTEQLKKIKAGKR